MANPYKSLNLAIEKHASLEVIKEMIDAGADVNEVDACGRSVLWHFTHFSYNKDIKIAELLLNSGADVNLKDDFGLTPLLDLYCYNSPLNDSKAPIQDWENYVRDLTILYLQHGADINERDDEGNTLIQLFYDSHISLGDGVYRFLIENGADITMVSEEDGLSLLDRVKNGDIMDEEICELIRNASIK